MGEMIHESTVEGYQFAYHLIDMKARMAAMKGSGTKGSGTKGSDTKGSGTKGSATKGYDMSQMKSHHLMVYIMGPEGKMITGAKVGYKVTGPDGADQKTMAMGMKGGFGADVDLEAEGTYQIKTKAVAGGVKLIDEFKYEVD
jgi:hypothetical protein